MERVRVTLYGSGICLAIFLYKIVSSKNDNAVNWFHIILGSVLTFVFISSIVQYKRIKNNKN